jgi:Tfp pilus assembly protein PilO
VSLPEEERGYLTLSLNKILSPEKLTLYLLVLMLIIIVFFYGRQLSALGERREALKLEEEALAADQARLLYLEGLAAESPQLRRQLEISNRLIPERASAHELFVYLHEIAYISGMQQVQVDFAEEVPHAEYVELPMSFSLALRLDDLLVSAVEGEGQDLLEVELNMSAFYRN